MILAKDIIVLNFIVIVGLVKSTGYRMLNHKNYGER